MPSEKLTKDSLDAKANTGHTHTISNVTNLQTTLDGKASSTHTHTISDVTNLQTTLDGKASSSHSHSISDVTNLQSSLNAKANSSDLGTVATSNSYEDLDDIPSSFTPSSHTHAISEVTNLQTSLDAKAPKSHASSATTYGVGTTTNYGHVKTINGLTQSSHSNGTALSAYQGKVLKDAIDAKPDSSDIPTKITDLTNDSDFIEKSATNGLVKNDGTIDTTSYSTFSGSYNDLSNKPTIPSASSTVPSADTTSGSYGSGTSYARSNHTHPKSSLYAEATHSHTKSQISDFPSIPSKTSDLTNDGDGTNAFLTQHQSLSNYVQKLSTSGLLKNDGSVDTNTYLTSSAISGMLTTSDIANNLTTTTAGKVLDARQGKALADLIGDAITYINQ